MEYCIECGSIMKESKKRFTCDCGNYIAKESSKDKEVRVGAKDYLIDGLKLKHAFWVGYNKK